jgi:hypothetical protein
LGNTISYSIAKLQKVSDTDSAYSNQWVLRVELDTCIMYNNNCGKSWTHRESPRQTLYIVNHGVFVHVGAKNITMGCPDLIKWD